MTQRTSLMRALALTAIIMLVLMAAGCSGGSSTSWVISGTVTFSDTGQPASGVLINISGHSPAVTNAGGQWSKAGIKGPVVVTPSKDAGWSFVPSSQTVTGPSTSVNFVCPLGAIQGYVYRHENARGIQTLVIGSGEVVPLNFIPLEGAEVSVFSGPTYRTATSDSNGHFTLPQLIPGSYVIRVQHPRFTGIELWNLNVASGQTTNAGDYSLGSLHMLFLGVSDYAYISDLRYTENDARLMKETLWTDNFLAGQFDMLLSGHATKAGILSAIQDIGSRMQHQDTFIMFFAGHGALDLLTGTAYICPYDTQLPPGGGIVNGISDSELRGWINQYIPYSKSHRSIFIFDSCNSGGMFQGASASNFVVLGRGIDVMARNLTGDGHIVITACAEDEEAYEYGYLGGIGHGLFTWCFAQGMRTMAADADLDGWVTVQEAFNYARIQVPLIQPRQTPQMYIGNHYGGLLYRPLQSP